MANVEYSDTELLKVFMQHFHQIADKGYWGKSVRPLGRTGLFSRFQVKIFTETRQVIGKETAMLDSDMSLGSLHMRAYLTESESIYFPRLLEAAQNLDVVFKGDVSSEVQQTWRQMAEEKYPFYVDDGVAVGARMAPDVPLVRWDGDVKPVRELSVTSISLLDVCDAYWNGGLMHPNEPQKRPKKVAIRTLVNSIPAVLRTNMIAASVSAAVLITTALHHAVGSDDRFKCGAGCPEMEIMKRAHWVSGASGPEVSAADILNSGA